jgi:hypothetical protein
MFDSLLDVAVATTPKGALHAKSPFGIPVAPAQLKLKVKFFAVIDS